MLAATKSGSRSAVLTDDKHTDEIRNNPCNYVTLIIRGDATRKEKRIVCRFLMPFKTGCTSGDPVYNEMGEVVFERTMYSTNDEIATYALRKATPREIYLERNCFIDEATGIQYLLKGNDYDKAKYYFIERLEQSGECSTLGLFAEEITPERRKEAEDAAATMPPLVQQDKPQQDSRNESSATGQNASPSGDSAAAITRQLERASIATNTR